MHFKNNQIAHSFWLMGFSTMGMVATKTLSATKTAADLVKTPQSVSVITRNQMNAQDVTSVSQALRYSAGVFTEYRGSSNRNDEVFVRGCFLVVRSEKCVIPMNLGWITS